MFLVIRVTNLVQGERKNKFYLSFPSRSLISPQCHTEAKVIIKFTIHISQFTIFIFRTHLFANFRTAALIRLIFKCSFQSPQFLGGHRHDGAVAGEEVFSE